MADESGNHLLLYGYVEDMADRRGPYREAHIGRIRAEQDAGRVTLAGALGDPPTGGAIVFEGVDRAHIETFVGDDPYVTAGLVTSWLIEPWRLI
jgi:uncharacterized protein YciI